MIENIENNYTSYDLIKKNELIENDTINFTGQKMKFEVIVGNPPYQASDGGAQASARPIYHHFVNISKRFNPSYMSIIMPTRWYAGGKGLDKFREQMLNDVQIVELHDFLKPALIFPNTNNRGGICYLLWNNKYNNLKDLTTVFTYNNDLEKPIRSNRNLKTKDAEIFIRHRTAIDILKKVKLDKSFETFENHISSLRPFGFRGYFTKSDKFRASKQGLKNPVTCYGKRKLIGYLEKNEITKNTAWIDKYKVYTPRANNIGTELNDDNLNTFIGEPNTICTESYIVVGVNLELNRIAASNLCRYFKTKFARFQHSVAKISQDGTSKTYKFVPLQDFTSKSAINWNKSIKEIDQQLYKKYKLTNEEVKFIEKMIKPM